MNKNLTAILTTAALIGAGYFVYQNMKKGETTTTTTTGGGYGGATDAGSGVILRLVPPGLDPQLKAACDASYSIIGTNRYLCYRGLKQPKSVSGHIFI